ncbi:MAG TPA: PAS domain S-box protein [Nitrospirota bacterium]|nr:PAS domain S-box protein [Nitrospirota bacterium]
MTKLAIAKGCCYVLLTALMLYMLVSRWTAEMSRDIEERKQVEQALQDSEANLNRAQEIAHIGSWHLDIARNQLTWSDEVYRLFAIPRGTALSYEAFLDKVHPEDRQGVDRAWAAALQRAPYDIEHRILVGGESRWVREKAEVEFDREGKAVKGIGTVQDITELKRAEEAVRQERQRLFDVLETLPIMVSLLKPDHKVVFVNRSVREKHGEPHGRPCYEYRFGSSEPCSSCEITEMLKTGRSHHWEFTDPDGRVIDAHDFPFTDVDGSPMILEMHIDITERKRAEEKIRQHEIELRQVLEFAPQLVAVFGPDRERLYANRPALDYFGVTLEEWQGIPDLFWSFHPDDRERVATDVYTGPGSDVPHEFEARMRRKDGAHRWFLFRGNPLRDGQGRITRWYLSATDIEDRKRAEDTLRRLNRELRAMSNCNQILMRATDEQSLLEEICRIVCEEAGYRMAWVGYVEHDEAKSVRPVAWTGAEEGYLATANITWADTARGRGPAGTAIRSGESCCIQDYANDPLFAPWRESALQRGYRSGIVLPLKDEHAKVFGCFCIYSAQSNAFTSEEIRLLEELAADLAFGIVALRSRAARKRAEQEVALLSFALNKISEAAFLIDDGGRFHYTNEEGCRVLGYTREEMLGLSVSDIDPDFGAERWAGHWRDLKAQRSMGFESRHRTRDGHILPVEVSANYFEYGGRAYNLALARDITERTRAEESLRRSESYLAESQRLTHTGSFAFDVASNKYIYLSEECSRVFELEAQKGLPTREAVSRLIHPEDWDRVKGDFEKLLREKVDTSSEFRVALPSGTAKHIQAIRHPILNDVGDVVTVVGTAIDITERKAAEEALRLAGVYNRSLIEASLDPLVTIDPEGRITDVNAATEQVTGYTRFELIGTDFSDYFTEPEKARAGYQQAFDQGFVRDYELEIRNRNGEITPVLYNASVYRDDTGNVIGVFAAARDMTEQRRAEEARSRLAAIVESSDDAIISKDLNGTITSWNQGAERLYGYSAAEALGRHISTLTPPDQQDEITKFLRRIREGGSIERYETERIRKDGRRIDASLTISPVRNHRGQIVGASAIAHDITERKRAEAEINSLKNYLSSIIDSMPSILVGMDNARTVTQWNRQAEAFTGIPAGDAIGKPIAGLLPGFAPWIMTMGNAMDEHRPSSMEKLLIEKEGERRFYDLMLYPLLIDSVTGVVLRIEDVTERARIQELMVQTEKMMSIGGLAAGMAHEINNPLGIITQAAQNIERRISLELPANRKVCEELGLNLEGIRAYFDKRQIGDFIASIRTASSRAAKIVGNMLQFSRRADTTTELASLAEVIDQALELAASDYDLKKKYDFRSIEIIKDYQDTPQVPIVALEIEQVILNLLRNAAQAMIANPPDRRPRITLRLCCEDRYAVLEVEDDGPGMTEDIRRRVFEPFFTTKEPGVGTGLGLSVSYMIVTQNHKGLMEVQSTPGKGTVFKVRLPIGGEQI